MLDYINWIFNCTEISLAAHGPQKVCEVLQEEQNGLNLTSCIPTKLVLTLHTLLTSANFFFCMVKCDIFFKEIIIKESLSCGILSMAKNKIWTKSKWGCTIYKAH